MVMLKKYELTEQHPDTGLYCIKALRDFGNVAKGDIGGWIEGEKNLSHEGYAWVYGDAWVYGNAEVSGNARVYGNAEVSGNARVYGDAWVYGYAWVSGNARVYGNARVSGYARVYGNARVSGNARVYGDAWVSRAKHTSNVWTMTLGKHTITVDGDYLNIGCESHTIKQWLKNFRKIGEMAGYSPEEIERYGDAITMINKWLKADGS